MEVKTFVFLQVAVFIALGIQIFMAGTDALSEEDELFSVEYCGMNCTKQDDGSWTTCTGKCSCYHEDGKTDGLCLSTEYTDFTQFSNLTDAEIDDATPRPRRQKRRAETRL
ncbi:evasin P1132-like [Ixodes scapularis]|uniref:evasin P1132-like n=1 Tax=Ixodes scapularis TaxID=6945 RepID=UPI001A9E10AB|nr:evasin P1132-like [Ixodes scapularis]